MPTTAPHDDRHGRDGPGHDAAVSARRQRADARISFTVARIAEATRVVRLAEQGSARLRVPNAPGPGLEAVTINTGGGITGGDRFATSIEVGAGAELVVTSAAAEKLYRAESEAARVSNAASVQAGGRLDWLPQETILFDGARLRRSLDVALHPEASVLLFEATVFGRAARGERMLSGSLQDAWRVRRGDRLVFADTLRLSGAITERLARPAVGRGARAIASCLYVAPDAEGRLDEARAHLVGSSSEHGASAWNGMLLVRFLSPDIEMLRRDAARFMTLFRARPLPRVWNL